MRSAARFARLKAISTVIRRRLSPSAAIALAQTLLATFEAGFLGVVQQTAVTLIAESGWQPDRLGTWCPRCAATLRGAVDPRLGCARCAGGGQPRLGEAVVRLGEYQGPLREWILQLKYSRHRELGRALGAILGEQIRAAIPAGTLGRCGGPLVIPMPMPFWRREHRGIDHAGELAEAVAERLGCECRRVLCRSGAPLPQTGRSRRERRRLGGAGLGVKNGLAARISQWLGTSRSRERGRGLDGRCVVLVDDVRTTGTSLAAVVRQLRRAHPAAVIVAVAACAEPNSSVGTAPRDDQEWLRTDTGRPT